eukprot:COSAG03_NODE_137_length_11785_cov_19.757827_9_plen_503_part_00
MPQSVPLAVPLAAPSSRCHSALARNSPIQQQHIDMLVLVVMSSLLAAGASRQVPRFDSDPLSWESTGSLEHKRVSVWWKPANATSLDADVAGMKRVLYATDVIIYCGFAPLPDGSFGVASSSGGSWGDPALCRPAALAARAAGLATQLVVEGRFDAPNIAAAVERGGAAFGEDVLRVLQQMRLPLGVGGVGGLNLDWEPGRNRSAPAPSEAAAAEFTAALARRLGEANNMDVAVDAQPYPGLPWRNLSNTLSAGGVECVFAMGLYHGTSSSEWNAKLVDAVRSVGSTNVAQSPARFAVGMQAGQTKFAWENTTESIAERFEALQRANVRHVGIFAWARGGVSGGAQRPPPEMLAEWSAQLRAFTSGPPLDPQQLLSHRWFNCSTIPGGTQYTNPTATCTTPTWKPTYNMSLSSIIQPCNYSGAYNATYAAQYGIMSIDWSNEKDVWVDDKPMDAEERLMSQAAAVKDINPDTKIWLYRNLVAAQPWYLLRSILALNLWSRYR